MVSRTERKRRVDATLYDTVLYLLLLHQSGASQHEAVHSLVDNASFFGYAAEEFAQVVTDTSCGSSTAEALERLSTTTPSEKLRDFLIGYIASVKATGSAVSFLEETLVTLQEEKHQAEKRYLSSLSVMGEVYLTLFVAAPLFAVIALMVLGMISGVDPAIPAVLVFVVFPLGTVLFLLLVDSMETLRTPYQYLLAAEDEISYRKRDGGDERKEFQMLKTFDRRKRCREVLRHPIEFFTDKPWAILFASLPVSLVSLLCSSSPYLLVSIFLLIAFIPFAFFFSRKERQSRLRESAVPDFFRRLSDTVSQGATLADAVHLSTENKSPIEGFIYRLSSDIRFGESITSSFSRFASSMKLMSVHQAAILLKETSRFTVDTSKTLTKLSFEMRFHQTAKQERASEMSLYVTVIYLGYFVYLFVMGIMLTVFLDAMALSSGASAIGIGEFPIATYETILIGSSLIQGICSGISAGKMGASSVLSGVKHACILLGVGTAVFFGMGLI